MRILLLLLGIVLQTPLSLSWHSQSRPLTTQNDGFDTNIIPAADQFYKYRNYIKGKRLGLVINHTAMVGDVHLVDTLLNIGANIKRIFAPEHGFRGNADAGEKVKDGVDSKTKIPITSLYGSNKRPTAEQMKELDLVIFDIQDVGTRFYTYTSTMTYIMEACAENGVPLLILDRPNPNGHYVDGPILEAAQRSFVGLHPVPIVHGLTVAEYARMINGEYWLKDSLRCELYHVECLNYNHNKFYELPVKPSPNLPNMHSIYLYPSLCWFEGTSASVGRGTNKQFQIYGHPQYKKGDYSFTPSPKPGAKKPKHNGIKCAGFDLSKTSIQNLQKVTQLQLEFVYTLYQELSSAEQADFFRKNGFFNLLTGNDRLHKQIIKGESLASIRKDWQKDLAAYKVLRKKYLLYQDFE